MFQCELCPATCGRKTDLRLHMRKLHGQESVPLECRKCHQTFDNRYSYKLHLRSHDGEHTYVCCELYNNGNSSSKAGLFNRRSPSLNVFDPPRRNKLPLFTNIYTLYVYMYIFSNYNTCSHVYNTCSNCLDFSV